MAARRLAVTARRVFVAFGFVASVGLAGAAGAVTVQVKAGDATPDAGGCGDAANPCGTIQAGVDNAAPGDVVDVAAGDYLEDVDVATPGITLRGAGTLRGSLKRACVGDPTRTDFVGGPRTQACKSQLDQASCEASWHLGEGLFPTPASCFWNGEGCFGCGARSEADGLCTNSCDPVPPAALHIGADDVTVEKLRVRGTELGGITVLPAVQNASIRGVRIEGAGTDCIAALGDGLTVERSSLRSCGRDCVVALGDGTRIEKSRLRSCAEEGIETLGAGARILRNNLRLAGRDCIEFRGDGATVERNQLTLCDDSGIEGSGSAVHLLRNQIRGTFEGIAYDCRSFATSCEDPLRTTFLGGPDTEACELFTDEAACETAWHIGRSGAASCFWTGASCRGCGPRNEADGRCANTCVTDVRCEALASANRVTDALGDCLGLTAVDGGLVAERNRAGGCMGDGFELEGVGVLVRGNTVVECGVNGSDHGFSVERESEAIVLEGNSARGCSGDGFNVGEDALDVTLVGNVATDNGQDGFGVEDGATGTSIERAMATSNIEIGIEVRSGATDTRVTGSRASGNLFDFCDEGTATTATANQFGTTSTTCIPDDDGDDEAL